jgi:hypothetical protein
MSEEVKNMLWIDHEPGDPYPETDIDWEQARKNPDATARAYLTVIARNPEAVAEWLRAAA